MKYKIMISLVCLMSSFVVMDSASAQSKSYKLGYTWATETNPDTLISYLIKNSFDLNGNPIRSKVANWCDSVFSRENWNRVNIQGKSGMNKNDWVKGCTAKVMTYKFRSR